jgi:hypothetical protein
VNRKRYLVSISMIFTLLVIILRPIVAQTEIPDGFRGILLGMDLQQVKDRLLEDPYFDYRGDPDVSFLPQTQESLIECRGFSYIERAYFQFHEKKLYIIIILINQEKIDHYSLFSTLMEKYGEFNSLSPDKAVWESGVTLFSLERPLSVKYIDKRVFNAIKDAGASEDSFREITREQFLEQF